MSSGSLRQSLPKLIDDQSLIGFTDRGLIRQGAIADLVLFDPSTVIDRATPFEPTLLSEGIISVWVGGELVFADSAETDSRPGKIIRRLMR